MKYGVFISYSHADAELIEPVVRIIRTMRNDRVFQDKNDIQPGQPWEIQLTDALEEAKMVVVFWCSHSAASAYVREEYLRAIETKKKVLPVILDSSVMDKDLSAYQWIDMKDVITHGFTRSDMQAFLSWKKGQSQPMEQMQRENYPQASLPSPSPRRKRVRPVLAVSLAVLLTVIISTLVFIRRPLSHSVEPTSYHPGPTETSASSHAGSTIVYIVGLLLLITLIVYLISKYTRKRQLGYQSKSVSTRKLRFDKDVFLPGQASDGVAGTGKAESLGGEDKNTIAAQMIVERIRSQMQNLLSKPDDVEG